MKISEEKKKAYEDYLNSPEAKLERFLDKLDEERRQYEVKSAKSFKKNYRRLSRSLYND